MVWRIPGFFLDFPIFRAMGPWQTKNQGTWIDRDGQTQRFTSHVWQIGKSDDRNRNWTFKILTVEEYVFFHLGWYPVCKPQPSVECRNRYRGHTCLSLSSGMPQAFVDILVSRICGLAWGRIICSPQTQLVVKPKLSKQCVVWCWCLQRYLAELPVLCYKRAGNVIELFLPFRMVCPTKWTNSTSGTCRGLSIGENCLTIFLIMGVNVAFRPRHAAFTACCETLRFSGCGRPWACWKTRKFQHPNSWEWPDVTLITNGWNGLNQHKLE